MTGSTFRIKPLHFISVYEMQYQIMEYTEDHHERPFAQFRATYNNISKIKSLLDIVNEHHSEEQSSSD